MKPWYTSKTIWANVMLILAAIQQSLPAVQGFIEPQYYAWILFFAGVLNIGLRTITQDSVTTGPAK